MRDTSVIEIDLSAVASNMALLRHIVGPSCAICAVVKADGYGLGATRVARCLVHAGADMLAVYTPSQAAELFRAAVSGPILVLMPVRGIDRADELYRGLVCGRLHLSIHDGAHLSDLIRLAERFAVSIPVHLEVDTGMTRGGCALPEAPALLSRIAAHPRLQLAGIYTHFACAERDEAMTLRQAELFEALLRREAELIPEQCIVHAANTCATLRDRRYHRGMIRIGQAWAGYGPECIRGGSIITESERLQPAVSWTSTLIQLKTIEAGCNVGYGAAWTAPRCSVIGLIPIGYADGYPVALGGRVDRPGQARVAIVLSSETGSRRAYVPVVGAVSMDQITVDLTELSRSTAVPLEQVRVGTTVELITPDRSAPNHLVSLSEIAGTVPYEILCRLHPRIRRVYHQRPTTVEVMPAAAHAAIAS